MTAREWPELDLTLTEDEADTRWGRGHRPTARMNPHAPVWHPDCECGCNLAWHPAPRASYEDALATADERLIGAEHGPVT